jgi:hypothetical protein
MVLDQRLPYHELGSGYQTNVDLDQVNGCNGVFLHSYQRDIEIGKIWFRDQGIAVPDAIWQQAQTWHSVREVQRLV